MKTLWTLGGHDPNGVAGVQADLLTARTLGVMTRTLIGSFTAQSDRRVSLSEPVPKPWLKAQWQTLREQEKPAAIKLGLLNHRELLVFLREALVEIPDVPVIADPVFASSSGHNFSRDTLVTAWRELLFSRLTLLTPNIPETEQLVGYRVDDAETVVKAATELRSWGLGAILIKGGHSKSREPADYFDDGQRPFWLIGKRVNRDYRGTGCTLAAGISAQLVKGLSLREAVITAHGFLQTALARSAAMESPYLQYDNRGFHLSGLSYHSGETTSQAFAPLGKIGFYPIVPDISWLKRLVDAGAPSIQLRMKDAPADQVLKSIREAVPYCRERGVQLFINDYWQLAIECHAFGVHLGQEDLDLLTPRDLRMLQKSGLRLGISTHSYEEAARAVALRPSYIALGPIFQTTCKSMAFGPQGMERVREWKELCGDIPLVAIGGLKLEHAPTLLSYGAAGLSVITDVLAHVNPEARVRDWLNSFATISGQC
jgi:hydroxymethylpyrimidine kinase/phosphomethylpyrimidine kinase/thiamine-phosphate diphosphorylase